MRQWIGGGAVVLLIGGALLVRAAEPVASPATQPAHKITAPATAPVAKAAAPTTAPVVRTAAPVVPVAENDYTSRRDRGRRGRGNRGAEPALSGADAYSVLQTRSIFKKGDQTVAAVIGAPGGFIQGRFPGTPESALVFNGVINVNGEANALIENLGDSTVATVRAGDALSGGRVSSITFDDLAYQRGTRTLHVQIGQNLEGVTASSSYPLTSFSSPGTTPAGTGSTAAVPGATGVAPPPGGAGTAAPDTGTATPAAPSETSTDDIIARLKARRQQEQGGGK